MSSLHDLAWEKLKSLLDANQPIDHAWNEMIDFLENQIPASYWPEIRRMNVIEDQNKIVKELENVRSNSPFPESVVALWIGITKLFDSNLNEEYYSLYLAGANSYDEDDADWAVDPIYFPKTGYITSEIINKVDKLIANDPNYSFLDWILPIAYSALTLNDIIERRLDKMSFLKIKKGLFGTKYRELLHVTVGYDDGDFINLKPIAK